MAARMRRPPTNQPESQLDAAQSGSLRQPVLHDTVIFAPLAVGTVLADK